MLPQLCWKSSSLPLIIPFFNPGERTKGHEIFIEELARLVILAFQALTTVEVHIILPAVPIRNIYSMNISQIICMKTFNGLKSYVSDKVMLIIYLVWFWLGNLGSYGTDFSFFSASVGSRSFGWAVGSKDILDAGNTIKCPKNKI